MWDTQSYITEWATLVASPYRVHTGIGRAVPADRVHNLTRKDIQLYFPDTL